MKVAFEGAFSAATLWLALALLSAALVTFSQIGAVYDFDEGLHLVAALAVRNGRQPYVDFFYWHQPLYLYVASAWMAVFGETWRSVHMLSAVLTAACTILVGLQSSRVGQAPSRTWTGIAGATFFALNVLVLKWGTIGHNYALCLLSSVAAVRLVIVAAHRATMAPAFWAGFCAGGAMATSLLIVPLGPVSLMWLNLHSTAGSRRAKSACFVGGSILPFLPLLLVASEAPYQTFFGIVAHHRFYRITTDGLTEVDWRVFYSWIRSPQALLLISLSALGLWSVVRSSEADGKARSQLYLCASLVLSIGAFVSIAHPPALAPYFVLLTPFLAILAAAGAGALAMRARSARANGIVLLIVALFGLGTLRSIYRERLWVSEWSRLEAIAAVVNGVTPEEASFYTSYPFIYFAARRLPPPGLENAWVSSMNVSPDTFARLQVLPESGIVEKVLSGGFETIVLWRNDSRFDAATLNRVYRQARELDRYFVVLWNPVEHDSPPR